MPVGDDSRRFARGSRIVVRYRVRLRDGRRPPGFTHSAIVLRDDPDEIVIAQPAGSGTRNRVGTRADPTRRQLLTDEWHGEYADSVWEGPGAVKVHRPGESFSVWRWWDGSAWSADRYINLEDPWTRTEDGFDTGDWVLDVVASDEDGVWRVRMKDEDELAVLVDLGEIGAERAATIRATGAAVAQLARDRDPIFFDGWDEREPDPDWGPVPLPPLDG